MVVDLKITSAISNVKVLILDFDGVLTDNRVLVDEDGKESVWCHRGDGLGIRMVRDIGIYVSVVSSESNKVVQARCDKLGISCYFGIKDKLSKVKELSIMYSADQDELAYIGNDLNDIEVMNWVGISIAVADAYSPVKEAADVVLTLPGGHGAVREFCEQILQAS